MSDKRNKAPDGQTATATRRPTDSRAGNGSRAPDNAVQAARRTSGTRQVQTDNDRNGNRPARLRILDKEVQIACKPGEEDDLLQAAAYIDRSMRDLRQRNATSSIEKIAIVTAINTANALLKSRSLEGSGEGTTETGNEDIIERLSALNSKLDELLDENVANSTTIAE